MISASTALAALSIVLVLAACDVVPYRGDPPRMGLSRSEVEQFARISLCSAAGVPEAYTEKDIDRFTLVKFSVPVAELEGCLRQAGYTEPLKEYKLTFGETTKLRMVPPWWTPSSAVAPLAAERMESGFFRKTMVDRADPARPVIYLSHYEF